MAHVDEIITFEDELAALTDEFTHFTGMALCATSVNERRQFLDSAAETFDRLVDFARNVYNTTDTSTALDDDALWLGVLHPFNEQLQAAS